MTVCVRVCLAACGPMVTCKCQKAVTAKARGLVISGVEVDDD